MDSRTVRILLATSFLAIFSNANGQAHEEVELMPDFILREILVDGYETSTDQLAEGGAIERGILDASKAWSHDEPIRVCFFEGSRELRRRIVSVASAWELAGTTIKFDFGDRNNPQLCGAGSIYHIRVGYSMPGYWSYVGQDSLVYARQTQQSLNLARFNVSTIDDPTFRRVVLHEFGHALGLHHEHQEPDGSCEAEFNWPVVYEKLGGYPNFWEKSVIDYNMRSRGYFAGDVRTGFNPNSIMLYSFPPVYYLRGEDSRCYAPQNTTISAGDVELIAKVYGVGVRRGQLDSYAAIRAAIPTLPAGEQEFVNRRLDFLQADIKEKSEIIGNVRPELLDVDVFACNANGASIALRDEVVKQLASQPSIGRLRSREQIYPNGDKLANGVTVVSDTGHPESDQAKRVEATLETALPGLVMSVANDGSVSRWYISVVACAKS
ncbi:hypothetical protein [Luteimonas saliphila]|uniref:hypothetical protein n=1 Tax=Luteimonas saliphila TaxID=2804919 RepID=UPI00192D5F82|nr:hypothetical protein [Luteimonas saliphila]